MGDPETVGHPTQLDDSLDLNYMPQQERRFGFGTKVRRYQELL